jgi:adenine deaminase
VIRIIPDQIVTTLEVREVATDGGFWRFGPEADVALIASIERHRGSGRIGLGLVAGLGLSRGGALGSSVAHDSHNLIVAGTDAEDMLACVRALEASGGGFVVASGGEARALLPLPVAGLLSESDAGTVCDQLSAVHAGARGLGCRLSAPFATLSFLALPVIPELRITTRGLFEVKAQRFLKL